MSKFSNSDRNGRREAIPSDGKQQSVKVADFSSRTYWEQRFKTETTFEWLQPSDSLLPTIESEISVRRSLSFCPCFVQLTRSTSTLCPTESRPHRPIDTTSRMWHKLFIKPFTDIIGPSWQNTWK